MKAKILDGFMNIKLIAEGTCAEGRKLFWNHCMEVMTEVDNREMASLIFGKKIEGVGGYFTGLDYINRIVLPEDAAEYNPDNNTVKFVDDKAFAVFIHEWGHFEHLAVDKGKFISPAFEHLDPFEHAANGAHLKSNTKYMEYEAGYRSLYNNAMYELFEPGDRTVIECNLTNMVNYMTFADIDAYKESVKDMTDEQEKEYCQNLINEWKKKIVKFSEISDFLIHL